MSTKVCSKCKKELTDDKFYTDHGLLTSACKNCLKSAVSARYYSSPGVRKKAKEAANKWVINNPQKRIEAILRYVRNPLNRPKYNAAWNKRRAKELGNGGSYTGKEWQQLKHYYNDRCLHCDKQEPEIKLTADHVLPISKGGSNNIDNIQPLCKHCNSSKLDKYIDYRVTVDYASNC